MYLRFVPLVGIAAALLVGCETMQSSRPVTVFVRDAETKMPIPQASARISYPVGQAFFLPTVSTGLTADDGAVPLRATPVEDALITLEITARGYLDEMTELAPTSIASIEPAHYFEDVRKRPPAIVVELYAAPRPTIELIVPVGYKGLIKSELEIREDSVSAKGQRTFSVPVDPTGVALAAGPPLLKHVDPSDYVGQFADGTPLPRNAPNPAVGLWWFKHDGDFEVFFVGTDKEFSEFRKAQRAGAHDGGHAPGEGGGKRGGGRHGRGRM
jgi:hypothetical protein